MKQFLKFVPVQLTFFLIIGIIIGKHFYFQPILLVLIVSFLMLFLSIAYFKAKKQFQSSLVFTLLFFLISFFIGVSSITYKNQLNRQEHYSNCSEFKLNKQVSILIKIQKVLKSNLYYNKYEAEVLQLNNKKSIGKILVNIKKDSIQKSLKVDDNLVVKTQFKTINKPLNPFGFNYKKYLQNQQIYHQINLNKSQFLIIENTKITIKGISSKIRSKINQALKNNGFKNDELAVINALLLGQRNSITNNLLESYVGAGAVHILAVSGLHVGIILLLLTVFFKPLHNFKNGKLIAVIFIVCLLWVYAIIAGLSASVVRAVTMFTALTIGMQLIQRSNIYNTLIISMFFLLLFHPFYLFEVGFQLSYLAVFSIVWIQPKLYNLWNPKFWLLTKFWQLLTVSLAAQLGVLPLSLFYFHQFPGLFFLSNLVIIPFLGIILIAGIFVITLAMFDILPAFFGEAYILIIQQMNTFVDWISNQESFLIENISFSLFLMLAVYLFIFTSLKWVEKKLFYRFIIALISFVLIQSVFIFEKYKMQTTNEFIVFNKSKSSIIAEKVGDSLLLNLPDSLLLNGYILKSYLIGTGLSKKYQDHRNKNLFKFKNEVILVVDSLGFYQFKTMKPSMVIIENSPKINIDRLLKMLQPKIIIADGSNYKNSVARWKQTCIQNKTPFYSTTQKGAFILK
ncbi:MAG: ComEC/Rec2 family competence protein [Lutibacter sp.]|uniref:ComEC/Rec2 family competence protein n=1 Tax=Lutibacter sp. TaxID=1925666 RepID=UPI00385B471E